MDIKILDYLDKDSVILGIKHKNKKNILSGLLDHLIQKKKIQKENKKEILKTLLQREEMGSTAIGGYIALPHARINSIKDIIVCFSISQEGVNFDSLDEDPVNIITLLISNQKEAGLHLKMLALLARLLRDKSFVQQLKNAKTEEEILALINKQQQAVG
jgi:fructose-specific phosphotransferase system IIA component